MPKKEKFAFADCLPLVKDTIRWAEHQDVSGLQRFLFTRPELPMYCLSSGGSSSALSYAALLYSAYKGMARMVTPLTFASFSDESIQNSKVLILSKSGKGTDVKYLTDRILPLNPTHTAGITHAKTEGENLLLDRLTKTNDNWFVYDWEDHEGFIATLSPFAMFGLFYKTFTNDSHFADKLDFDLTPAKSFHYRYLHSEETPSAFKDIKNYIVLYSGWSEPVAQDFESKMVESGIASVQLCDYRNFTHGRFIFLSNHLDDSALVLMLTPREKVFVDKFILNARNRDGEKLYPAKTQVVTLESEFDTPLAAVDLLYKEAVLFTEIGTSVGYDPNHPDNLSGIDKRIPRSIDFPHLLDHSGLKGLHVEPLAATVSIHYDPTLTLPELARANQVTLEEVHAYIQQRRIDRTHDDTVLLYNTVWKNYLADSDKSLTVLAGESGCTLQQVEEILQNVTPTYPVAEGKVGLVPVDTEIKKLYQKSQEFVGKFDKVKKIQQEHPTYTAEEICKELKWSLHFNKKSVAQLMQMKAYRFKFYKNKFELIV